MSTTNPIPTAPGQQEAYQNVQVLQQQQPVFVQMSPNLPAPQQQAERMQPVGQPPMVSHTQQPMMVQQQQEAQPRQISIQPMTMPAQQQPMFVQQGQQPLQPAPGSAGVVYYTAQPKVGMGKIVVSLRGD